RPGGRQRAATDQGVHAVSGVDRATGESAPGFVPMEEGMIESLGRASCPAHRDGLASLRLSAADIQALTRQGFVAVEYRQQRGPYHKLRWRADGRQHVRYLGKDPRRAEAIRMLLHELQEPRHLHRELAALSEEARGQLQEAKRLLAAPARAHGYHYH